MSVAARFKIDRVTRPNAEGVYVQLSAAIDGGNEDWAKYTPAGQITMSVNGPASAWFEERLGQVLALTFDDAPTGKED
jgi:hypothetical protein